MVSKSLLIKENEKLYGPISDEIKMDLLGKFMTKK